MGPVTLDDYKIIAERAQSEALFWRRVAFVYRHGSPKQIENKELHFDNHGFGWGEVATREQLHQLNHELMSFWEPVKKECEEE